MHLVSSFLCSICKIDLIFHSLRISYLEIYNEVIFDLLSTLPDATTPTATPTTVSSSGLCVSEDERGVVSVKGLSLRVATNEEDALNMLFEVCTTTRCIHIQNVHVYMFNVPMCTCTS